MELGVRGKIIMDALVTIKEYPYSYTLLNKNTSTGDVWEWILYGSNWRDKDFKWQGRTFFFKDRDDLLIFVLRWPN